MSHEHDKTLARIFTNIPVVAGPKSQVVRSKFFFDVLECRHRYYYQTWHFVINLKQYNSAKTTLMMLIYLHHNSWLPQ